MVFKNGFKNIQAAAYNDAHAFGRLVSWCTFNLHISNLSMYLNPVNSCHRGILGPLSTISSLCISNDFSFPISFCLIYIFKDIFGLAIVLFYNISRSRLLQEFLSEFDQRNQMTSEFFRNSTFFLLGIMLWESRNLSTFFNFTMFDFFSRPSLSHLELCRYGRNQFSKSRLGTNRKKNHCQH